MDRVYFRFYRKQKKKTQGVSGGCAIRLRTVAAANVVPFWPLGKSFEDRYVGVFGGWGLSSTDLLGIAKWLFPLCMAGISMVVLGPFACE